MRSVELFSGCGGLALGLSKAGFSHSVMIEWDEDAFATLFHNKNRKVEHVRHWPISKEDVREVDWSQVRGSVDLAAGGPPCQPFSIGGKHAGPGDSRDMWPEAIRTVRELRPKAFLFENVRGLLRPAFADYLRWIELHLRAPQLKRQPEETLLAHLKRLEAGAGNYLYDVAILRVNAADYGAPQKRNRVIVAGIRKDLNVALHLPNPTHSHARLVWDQWITGEYWERHGIAKPRSGPASVFDKRTVEKLRGRMLAPSGLPWKTCRDAFVGLGAPGKGSLSNHAFQPGARVYPGHTGSPFDEPAKALKAGDHGVPGGENMLVCPNGTVRYFTVREAARLQGMSDDFEFPRSWTESMRQLGNAVPVALAEIMGKAMLGLLSQKNSGRREAA
jgi:DNA (cytosine-5)-methyltransferase 1